MDDFIIEIGEQFWVMKIWKLLNIRNFNKDEFRVLLFLINNFYFYNFN